MHWRALFIFQSENEPCDASWLCGWCGACGANGSKVTQTCPMSSVIAHVLIAPAKETFLYIPPFSSPFFHIYQCSFVAPLIHLLKFQHVMVNSWRFLLCEIYSTGKREGFSWSTISRWRIKNCSTGVSSEKCLGL